MYSCYSQERALFPDPKLAPSLPVDSLHSGPHPQLSGSCCLCKPLQLILWRDVPSVLSGKHQAQVRAFYKCHGPSAGKSSLAVNSSTCLVEGSLPQNEAEITRRGSCQIHSCQLSTINQSVERSWRAVPSHSSVLQLGKALALTLIHHHDLFKYLPRTERGVRESYFMAT